MLKQKLYNYSVTTLILGGGAGSRLYPLTHMRAKPAVPFGGKYRLIDIPLSNCLNSGLNRIFILTQYNSTSLHRHISASYHFHRFSRGFVHVLAAQQTPRYTIEQSWYEGTADAVRKNLDSVREAAGDLVLILSGDQIYRMDYTELLLTHEGAGKQPAGDVTIAGLLVSKEQARSLGVMKLGRDGEVLKFVEKPGTDEKLYEGLEASPEMLEQFSLRAEDGPYYVANMGIYVFRQQLLESALEDGTSDFGKHVLPGLLANCRVRAHLFHGYWEDVGTIRTFHEANLALASPEPPFNFFEPAAPIYTHARLLPASKIADSRISGSLISDGCIIGKGNHIDTSLIGVRSVIGSDCEIRDSFVMGADDYEEYEESDSSVPPIGIGTGSVIRGAIVDKNARVGRNVRIENTEGHDAYEDGKVIIRQGIVVVPRGGVIPDGYSV